MFHHIAIPTKNLELSKKFYETLGFVLVNHWERENKELRALLLQHPDGWGIELVEHPDNEAWKSPAILETLHVGIVVDNIDAKLADLKKINTKILQPPTEGITVKRYCFVSDPSGFPVELLEKK